MFRLFIKGFGFTGTKDFVLSTIGYSSAGKILTVGSILAGLEYIFGLSTLSLVFLLLLLKVELITGLWASKVRYHKHKSAKFRFSSRRFQRFIAKFLVYFFFIMLFNVFSIQFPEGLAHHACHYLHDFLVMYVILVYAVSIVENMEVITGKVWRVKRVINRWLSKLMKGSE